MEIFKDDSPLLNMWWTWLFSGYLYKNSLSISSFPAYLSWFCSAGYRLLQNDELFLHYSQILHVFGCICSSNNRVQSSIQASRDEYEAAILRAWSSHDYVSQLIKPALTQKIMRCRLACSLTVNSLWTVVCSVTCGSLGLWTRKLAW